MVQLSIAAGLSLLFGIGALAKLREPAHFRAVLADYRLLPAALVPVAAGVVIAAEAGMALAVWLEPWRTTTLGGMGALLGVYWLAIAVNLARGRRDIDCGCGGSAARRSLSGWLLLRNGVLIGLALAAALGGGLERPLGWLDYFSIGAAVAVGSLLYASADGLLAQAPRLARLERG